MPSPTINKSPPCSSKIRSWSASLYTHTSLIFSTEKSTRFAYPVNCHFQSPASTRSYISRFVHIELFTCPCVHERFADVQYKTRQDTSLMLLFCTYLMNSVSQMSQRTCHRVVLPPRIVKQTVLVQISWRHSFTRTIFFAVCPRGSYRMQPASCGTSDIDYRSAIEETNGFFRTIA